MRGSHLEEGMVACAFVLVYAQNAGFKVHVVVQMMVVRTVTILDFLKM